MQPSTDDPQKGRVARARFQNWLMGWFSGFNVGSQDGGLGTIDLEPIVQWFFELQGYCGAQPAATFADAVRQLAVRVMPTRTFSTYSRPSGFGLARCAEVVETSEWSSAYAEWMFGFLSGYNAFREDVGMPAVRIADADGAWSSVHAQCTADSSTYLNAAVARWVLDEEERQKLAPIPANAQSTSGGLTAEATGVAAVAAAEEAAAPPVHVAGDGALICEHVIAALEADEPMIRAMTAYSTVGWLQGFLTAGGLISASLEQPRVDWRAAAQRLDIEQVQRRVEGTCRETPSMTYAEAVGAVHADLLESFPAGPSSGLTSLGVGSDGCGSLESPSPSIDDAEQFIRSANQRVLDGAMLRGWMAGFFSMFNEALAEQDASLLNLAVVEERGAAAVQELCKTNPSLRVYEAVVAFGAAAYPEFGRAAAP